MGKRATAKVIWLSDHRAVFVIREGAKLAVSLMARGSRSSRRQVYNIIDRGEAMAYAHRLAGECGCELHDLSGLGDEGAANG